jgi:hypothetical protein
MYKNIVIHFLCLKAFCHTAGTSFSPLLDRAAGHGTAAVSLPGVPSAPWYPGLWLAGINERARI